MDVLPDDTTFQAVIGAELGIDNAVFDQLEEYINDDICLPEDAIPAMAYSDGHPQNSVIMDNTYKIGNLRMMNTSMHQVPVSQPSASMYDYRGQGTSMPGYHDNPLMNPTLPDSPPDSEPYSPSDGHHSHALQKNKYSVGLPAHSVPHMYPPHHRVPGIPTGYNDPLPLNHLPTTQPQDQVAVTTMPHTTTSVDQHIFVQAQLGSSLAGQQNKKRKFSDSPNNTVTNALFNGRSNLLNIKQEPLRTHFPTYLPDVCDDDYSYDPDSSSNGFIDGQYQVIKWQPYLKNTWCSLTDADLKELAPLHYQVDADKGFNFYTSDNAFICQKKNHFQITVHMGLTGDAKYARVPEGVKKIDSFQLHFRGMKHESPSQFIKIEQSQSDRSKKPFAPVRVDLVSEQVNKITVGRLHFSETTSNNMRKKGRPNPDQRYFQLIVSVYAHCGDNKYLVCGSESERIIVRASNPGQFDSDVEAVWSKNQNGDAIHHGKVGINTDHPDESLTVHGNLKITGHIVHPSDIRIKQDLKEIDPKDQLKNVTQMKVYNYEIKPDFAEVVGLPDSQKKDTGLIAQDIQKLLPDAVIETGDVVLPNGKTIEKLLVVNKDRIFMENLGAVKELCKLTDNFEIRIDELEKMNTKLRKLNHIDSFKSTVSSKSSCSTFSSVSTSAPKKHAHCNHQHHHHGHHHKCPPVAPKQDKKWCSNKFIQITIITLIMIMAFCLIAITVLYILERQKDTEHHHSTVQPNIADTQKQKKMPVIWSQGDTEFHSTIFPSGASKEVSSEKPTMPTSSPAIMPVHIPIISHATVGPYPTCVPKMCEQHCCPPPSEDEQGNLQPWYNYPEPQYDINYTEQNNTRDDSSAERAEDSENVAPAIVTTKSWLNHIIIDEHQNGGSQPMVYSNDDPNSQNGLVNYRYRRDTDMRAQIVLKELNFTLGQGHCDSSIPLQCDYSNYTYHIGLHPYFGWQPITVQFSVDLPEVVYMCKNHTHYKFSCGDRVVIEGGDPAGAHKQISTEWRLAVGQHFHSYYKFRVSTEDHLYSQVCFISGNENDGIFTEYNLHFYRICGEM